jgi:hypothetical protein
MIRRVHPIIADVAYPTQDHRLWNGARALRIAGADLSQQRDQGVTDQCVYFIQQQHEHPAAARGVNH